MTLGAAGERQEDWRTGVGEGRAAGGLGANEGGPMMLITITVILEGWKSRHALLPVPPTRLPTTSNYDVKGVAANCFRQNNRNIGICPPPPSR